MTESLVWFGHFGFVRYYEYLLGQLQSIDFNLWELELEADWAMWEYELNSRNPGRGN